MDAIILSVGDELVLGQTVDTNSAWISSELAAAGCGVKAHMTVGDEQAAIEYAIRYAADRCDLLVISGGIGPTDDDLTRQALAKVIDQPLEPSEMWLERLKDFFEKRGRPMPAQNRIQAMIPRGARLIDNTAGTAAGIYARYVPDRDTPRPLSDHEPPHRPGAMTQIFVMPGVPKEMKIMFARDVLPRVRSSTSGRAIVSRTLHTFGLGESTVAERLGELMLRGRNPLVGTTVSGGIVSIRVYSHGESRQQAIDLLEQTVGQCRARVGEIIFGCDDETLPQVVARLLTGGGSPLTVATAESCTGGLLAKMLTDIPGSSDYFKQGWVTYSNDAKIEELGVPPETLAEHGAVSEATAASMATGARQRSGSTYALSISGIAGPGGGTAQKPVGTVCIGFAWEDRSGAGASARGFSFSGDREMVRDRSAKMALSILRFHLLGKPMPF